MQSTNKKNDKENINILIEEKTTKVAPLIDYKKS